MRENGYIKRGTKRAPAGADKWQKADARRAGANSGRNEAKIAAFRASKGWGSSMKSGVTPKPKAPKGSGQNPSNGYVKTTKPRRGGTGQTPATGYRPGGGVHKPGTGQNPSTGYVGTAAKKTKKVTNSGQGAKAKATRRAVNMLNKDPKRAFTGNPSVASGGHGDFPKPRRTNNATATIKPDTGVTKSSRGQEQRPRTADGRKKKYDKYGEKYSNRGKAGSYLAQKQKSGWASFLNPKNW